MPLRLVSLDEGPDILVERPMLVIGRHPQCDARLDSIRISRRHCCMALDADGLMVQDLGSTNGIRINGQRLDKGRLAVGDELAIAHLRYRLEAAPALQDTRLGSQPDGPLQTATGQVQVTGTLAAGEDNRLAAAVRELLPPEMAGQCQIQVIVKVPAQAPAPAPAAAAPVLQRTDHAEDPEDAPAAVGPDSDLQRPLAASASS